MGVIHEADYVYSIFDLMCVFIEYRRKFCIKCPN